MCTLKRLHTIPHIQAKNSPALTSNITSLTMSPPVVFRVSSMARTNPGNPQPLGAVDPTLYGTTGLCLIPEGLRYLDSNRVWVVPFFHAFYYGVIKRLFEITFPVPGAAAPKEYAEVSAQLPLLQPPFLNRVMVNTPEELKPSSAARKLIAARLGRIVSPSSVLDFPWDVARACIHRTSLLPSCVTR